MDPKQLLEYIIHPALSAINMQSKDAEVLVLATAAQESRCGHYIHQIGGPALGVFQMEPATHRDIYENFLNYRPGIKDRLKPLLIPFWGKSAQLTVNPLYAAAMARIQYYRDPEPIPPIHKLAMWKYYKRIYNTPLGAAEKHEWDSNWERYVEEVL